MDTGIKWLIAGIVLAIAFLIGLAWWANAVYMSGQTASVHYPYSFPIPGATSTSAA